MLHFVIERFKNRDARLLDEWVVKWNDLIDFEVIPIVTSKETAESIGLRL